jgi:hypothetical protein
MSYTELVDGPFGLDAASGGTVRTQRTVLAIVHSVVTGARLAEVLPLLESDQRIQVVFSGAPSLFPHGVRDFLRGLGGVILPWQQATRERFDLALAAGTGQLERVHAPVILMSHGSGYGKYPGRWPGYGPPAPRDALGAERQRLIHHGRVVPAVILLAHHDRLALLRESAPEAVPAAVIAGDPYYDRVAASMEARDSYRRALGVDDDQKLVLVTSTWGPRSLLGQAREVLPRLLEELPGERYRVVASLHPNAWAWHGSWQVRAWYAGCMRSGMALLAPQGPEEGWRAALAAADLVIGDHGSVTFYAASVRVPLLLATFPAEDVPPESHVAMLGKIAPRLRLDQPLTPQLEHVMASHRPERYTGIALAATSVPGEARRIIRRVMYQQLGLPEPPGAPRAEPVPPPRTWGPGSGWTAAAC